MVRDEMIVYDSIARSNIPRRDKSSIREWVEGMADLTPRRSGGNGRLSSEHVVSVAQMFRQNSEATITGGLMAAAHVNLRNGLDTFPVSIDGAGSIVGNLASVFLAKNEVSRDLLNFGSNCTTIYSFRKFYEVLAELKVQRGGSVGGTFGKKAATVAGEKNNGEDPVRKAAEAL